MAKRKTTELTTITAAALADGDWFPVVDVSDTTDSSTGTNKKIAKSELAGMFQPLDSDLTAIAALSTTSYGRAFLALADAAAGRTALGLGSAATSNTSAFDAAGTGAAAAAAAQAASQPLDSDLTAIAALSTTSYGRAFLALADAAAGRTALGVDYPTIAADSALTSRYAPFSALYFPGTSGNYVRTPDTATLDITGDITTVELIAAADWTPAATQYTLGKWEGSANHSYAQGIQNTTGCLQFIVSGNGSEAVTATSSVAPTITDGNLLWIKRDWQASDGRTRFYTATYDGTRSIPTSWTQLGSNQTAAATGSALYSGAGVLEIGGLEGSGSLRFVGRIGRSTVYSGIDGAATVVADFNPVVPASQFRDSTGKIFTVTGSAMGWESGPFS